MSTRAELLEAIRAHPAEDTPRLMYADWLDEHGDCDRDTATAEFIRLSVGTAHKSGRRRDSMPKNVYPWLLARGRMPRPFEGNFHRLVPSLLNLHVTSWQAIARRSGRWVEVQLHHNLHPIYRTSGVATHVLLEFRYGFLVHAVTDLNQPDAVLDGIRTAVAVDQPNAAFIALDYMNSITEWSVDWHTIPCRVNSDHAAQTE